MVMVLSKAQQVSTRPLMKTVLIYCSLLASISLPSSAFSPSTSKKRSFLYRLDRFLTKLQRPQEQLKDHTYLSGNYAPVAEEHVNVPVEVVYGELPADVDGMFIRNGPNPVRERLKRKYHWFDGHGMAHNLRIKNGIASYTNQFIPSTRYQVEEELDEDFFPTLGEYTGFFGLVKSLFHPSMVRDRVPDLRTVNPPNTACLMYRNKFYCLNEGNIPFECRILEDGRLEACKYETFDGSLDYPVSAHPRIDHNGDLLFHSYTINNEMIQKYGNMKVGKLSAKTGKLDSYFVPTTEKYITFAHNLLFTEHYMIVYDCSIHFDPTAMFRGGSFFRTNPEYNLRFGIIPKTATSREEVIWLDTGRPGGIVHPLNTWEEDDGTITIWTPLCENPSLDLESDDISKFDMVEFRLDPSTGKVTQETIDDSVNVEFCNIATMGRFTRFGYAAIQDPSTPGEGSFAGFSVWDMAKRKLHATVYYDENEVGGEVILIPRRDDDKSEQVYVGTYVHNLVEDQSYFVLYDGETTDLVARLKMPYRVPFGFHGLWISGDELDDHIAYHKQGERALVEA